MKYGVFYYLGCIHCCSIPLYKLPFQSLLCKYAFPDCVLPDNGIAIGLSLCQEDCIALRSHFCFNDWATIEDNKRRDIFVGGREDEMRQI